MGGVAIDPTLIAILIRDIALPEILSVIRAHHNATGEIPTNQQVLDALQFDAARVVGVGEAFLARTGGAAVPALPAALAQIAASAVGAAVGPASRVGNGS